MAKIIQKNFEGFKGVHKGMSDLTRPSGYSANTQNIQILDNLSITKRAGFRILTSFLTPNGIRGLYPYTYLDAETGETRTELLYNRAGTLYRVERAFYGLSSTRPTPTISFLPSGNQWQAALYSGGVLETGWPKTYGTGLPSGSPSDILDLRTDINATAGWSLSSGVTLENFTSRPFFSTAMAPGNVSVGSLELAVSSSVKVGAVVDGAQSNVTTITVDTGHDFATGDPLYTSFYEYVRQVASVTATTITIHGEPVTVSDNETLYNSALVTYAIIPLYSTDFDMAHLPKDRDYVLSTFVNQNNILYFTVNGDYLFKYDSKMAYRAGISKPIPFMIEQDTTASNTLFAYMGSATTTPTTSVVPTAGSGFAAGTYRYAQTFVFEDAQGNEVESDLIEIGEGTTNGSQFNYVYFISCPLVSESVGKSTSSTQTGVATVNLQFLSPSLRIGDVIYIYDDVFEAFRERTITAIDTATPSITFSGVVTVLPYTPIYVMKEGRTKYLDKIVQFEPDTNVNVLISLVASVLDIGDSIYLYDQNSPGEDDGVPLVGRQKRGRLTKRTITDIVGTSVYFDGAPVTIASGSGEEYRRFSSTGAKVRLYRTFAGGTDYYLLDEFCASYKSTTTYFKLQGEYRDGVADVQLGYKYLFPVRTPAPNVKCNIVADHQGIQLLAGADDNPNTVFFSEPTDIESYPVATNSFDIPFSTKGPITGLVSDKDLLVIFKQRGRAIIRGELFTGNFNVEIIEDGIGCSSHSSIAKTPIGDLFVSERGFQKMNRGEIDPGFSEVLATDFDNIAYEQITGQSISINNSTKMVPRRAQAVNDYRKDRVIFHIPAETGVVGVNKVVNPQSSKTYCFDYKLGAFIPYEMGETQIDGSGGMCIWNNKLILGGLYCPFVEYDRGDLYDYADNTKAIEMILQDNWEQAGEPSILKKFLRVKVWAMQPLYHIASWLTLKTYLNFNDTTPHTTATLDFTSSSTKERLIKLRQGQKARSLMVEFSNSNIHEAPIITGYELEIAPVYDKEIKE